MGREIEKKRRSVETQHRIFGYHEVHQCQRGRRNLRVGRERIVSLREKRGIEDKRAEETHYMSNLKIIETAGSTRDHK